MKRFITVILVALGFSGYCYSQTIQLDTLFYDSNGKIVEHPVFASWYRVIVLSDDNSPKPFRDYYMSGKLQTEGKYITINREDNNLSIFDGEIKNYYESGKLEGKIFWKNGKIEGTYSTFYENNKPHQQAEYVDNELNGKYLEYDENGTLIYEINYKNGKKDGIAKQYYPNGKQASEYTYSMDVENGPALEFNEEGTLVKQGNFVNGIIEGDYYELDPKSGLIFYAQMKNGDYSKYTYYTDDGYNMSYWKKDNAPIYNSPDQSERHVYMDNGSAMPYYVCNGILISMKYTNVKDYGKYARLDITIINRLDSDFEFDPMQIKGIERDSDGKPLLAISSAEYDKKIRKKQNSETFWLTMGNMAAAYNASTTTATTNYSQNRNNVTGYAGAKASGYASNTGYRAGSATVGVGASASSTKTTGTVSTTIKDGYASYMVGENNSRKYQEEQARMAADRVSHQADYLKKQTISQGSMISGYILLPQTKKTVDIVVPVHGVDYIFTWSN